MYVRLQALLRWVNRRARLATPRGYTLVYMKEPMAVRLRRVRREERHESQKRAALAMGLREGQQANVSRWEATTIPTEPAFRRMIAEYLKEDLDELNNELDEALALREGQPRADQGTPASRPAAEDRIEGLTQTVRDLAARVQRLEGIVGERQLRAFLETEPES